MDVAGRGGWRPCPAVGGGPMGSGQQGSRAGRPRGSGRRPGGVTRGGRRGECGGIVARVSRWRAVTGPGEERGWVGRSGTRGCGARDASARRRAVGGRRLGDVGVGWVACETRIGHAARRMMARASGASGMGELGVGLRPGGEIRRGGVVERERRRSGRGWRSVKAGAAEAERLGRNVAGV